MFDLSGRKALVTGASGGIGEAIARALHAQGATVGLHGTRVEKLEALAAELGSRTRLFPANLSSPAEVKALGQKAEAELEGVDILVNNAGITKDGLFVRMSDEDFDAVIDINLGAVFRLTRELTHPMMRRRFGRIINITSVVGVTGNPGPDQLRRVEGRHDRLLQGAGAGDRDAQHHRQLRGAGLHRIGDDRQAQRQAEGSDHGRHPRQAHGDRRRGRFGGHLSSPPTRPAT